ETPLMQLVYKISILEPHHHHVKVRILAKRPDNCQSLTFFFPVWSPGSYLVREYARHMRGLKASDTTGQRLFIEQIDKCRFKLDFEHPEFAAKSENFEIEYEV